VSGGFLIAVDGPAASGKGTIASGLARHYHYPYLDTGRLYRAVGVSVLAAGGDLDDEATAAAAAWTLAVTRLEDPALRDRRAGEAASRVAVHPQVRAALINFQRGFAAQTPGAVLDGRDIGTVIAPQAQAKLFVTATPEARAKRRWLQLRDQGEAVTFEEVFEDIRIRDQRDSARADAPLIAAADAVLLDTTEMTIDQAADAARRIVETARGRWVQTQAG
jgi:cytidylate kinase